LTRPIGAAVVAAVVIAAVVAWLQERRRARVKGFGRLVDRRLAAVLIAPSGLIGYLGWVAYETGSPDGYFDVTQEWGNGFDGGRAFGGWIIERVVGPTPLVGVAVLVGLIALISLVVGCARLRQPLPVLAYTVVLVTLALTTSGYFGSKPRYLLPAFPLLFPVASWLASRPRWVIAASLAAASVASAAYAAVWLLGPGPP
jgi:hypothetical protein